MRKTADINRRQFIGLAGMVAAGLVLPGDVFATSEQIYKAIPKTGEKLPVIGMGTSRTFDAGRYRIARKIAAGHPDIL